MMLTNVFYYFPPILESPPLFQSSSESRQCEAGGGSNTRITTRLSLQTAITVARGNIYTKSLQFKIKEICFKIVNKR